MTHLPRLRPVIEKLIAAQRDLDRAVASLDSTKRQGALIDRDAAALAIEQAFTALDMACDLSQRECVRLRSMVSNYAAVITSIDESNPLAVSGAMEKSTLPIGDLRQSSVILARMNDAVALGFAEHRDGRLRITPAGVAELIQSNERRHQVDTLRTQVFEAERRIFALEQLLSREQAAKITSPMIGAKRAAGGS